MSKCCIIASSEGSTFRTVYNAMKKNSIHDYSFYVITDRSCGVEKFCEDNIIPYQRIVDQDNRRFSEKARAVFEEEKIDFGILFFLRLVSGRLFDNYPIFNIHPSLLPAFRGFNAVDNAINSDVKFVGATLHLVNSVADGGKIIAQTSTPITRNIRSSEMANKVLYIHKVYLLLNLLSMMKNNRLSFRSKYSSCDQYSDMVASLTCNPAIEDPVYLKEFFNFQKMEGLEVLI